MSYTIRHYNNRPLLSYTVTDALFTSLRRVIQKEEKEVIIKTKIPVTNGSPNYNVKNSRNSKKITHQNDRNIKLLKIYKTTNFD